MKIALIGYGRMGHEIEDIAKQRGHEIVVAIDKKNHDEIHSDAFRSADVAIEFTGPESAYMNIIDAFNEGVKVVSGSTGWTSGHEDEMRKLCTEGGNTLMWSSNFSLGVHIFSSVNRFLADIMNEFDDYRVSMSETHHIHKLDAPSGTAVTLAKQIVKRLDRMKEWVRGDLIVFKDEGPVTTSKSERLTDEQLPVASVREGEVPGIHSIKYESEADSITITHSAKNRRGFALGAVMAAEYTAGHSGFLNMDDMFKF